MILVLKTSHHGSSDAKHNPSQLLRLLSKEVCFIPHKDQHSSIDFLTLRSLILKRWQSAPAFDYQITNVMRTSKYSESNAITLEDLTLRAGNPVKEVLLN
ncbi:hypothetical protein Tco_1246634 [Tanacetum coccineum]